MMAQSKEKLAEDVINTITKTINDNYEVMENWGKAFQMVFNDINVGYWIKVAIDGHVEKVEKGSESALKTKEAVVTMHFDTAGTLKGLLEKTISAQTAMSQGQLKVDGPISELIKLQLIFG